MVFIEASAHLKRIISLKLTFQVMSTSLLAYLENGAHPEYLTESKLVTDVKFLKDTEVEKNSVEWLAEETQRQARNIDNKAVNGKQYSS